MHPNINCVSDLTTIPTLCEHTDLTMCVFVQEHKGRYIINPHEISCWVSLLGLTIAFPTGSRYIVDWVFKIFCCQNIIIQTK